MRVGEWYNKGIMPELPEVETVRRGLGPFILNKKIVQVLPEPGKCFQGEAKEIEGAVVTDIRRRGKALLVDLDNGRTVMVHLRMTGQLIWRGSLLERDAQLADSALSAGALLAHRTPSTARSATPASSHNLATSASPVDSPYDFDELMKHQFAAGHPSKNFTDTLPNKQTRVIFVFDEGKLFFNDQRKFGFVKVMPTNEVEKDKFIAELAKEPWEMSPGELFTKCQRHGRSPIKAVLLNQKIIAGLGNIYADESLFYASVHPASLAGVLTEEQVAKILEGACKVMQAAIDSGGSTMATYIRPDGTTGDYLEKFAQVFRREGKECPRCGTVIEKTRCAGRGTHYCPKCQVVCPSKMPVEGAERT